MKLRFLWVFLLGLFVHGFGTNLVPIVSYLLGGASITEDIALGRQIRGCLYMLWWSSCFLSAGLVVADSRGLNAARIWIAGATFWVITASLGLVITVFASGGGIFEPVSRLAGAALALYFFIGRDEKPENKYSRLGKSAALLLMALEVERYFFAHRYVFWVSIARIVVSSAAWGILLAACVGLLRRQPLPSDERLVQSSLQ